MSNLFYFSLILSWGKIVHKQNLTKVTRVNLVGMSTDNPPSSIYFNYFFKYYVTKNKMKLFGKGEFSVGSQIDFAGGPDSPGFAK